MDISDISNIAHAWASWERNEANKGKGVRSKGWVTKEQMRRDAAQKTLALIIFSAIVALFSYIFIKVFGKILGVIVMLSIIAILAIAYIQKELGNDIHWLGVSIVGVVGIAAVIRIFQKFGRKWGLVIGIPIIAIIVAIAFAPAEKSNVPEADAGSIPRDRGAELQVVEESGHDGKMVDKIAPVNESPEEDGADNVEEKLSELKRKVAANTDAAEGESRMKKIMARYERVKNRTDADGRPHSASFAYDKCVEYARLRGWLPKEDKSTSAAENEICSNKVNDQAIKGGQESSAEAVELYLKVVSNRLETLIDRVRASKGSTTSNYELDSRVDFLRDKFDQGIKNATHCSFDEAKDIADKAFESCQEHAYRMHWIKTEEEKAIEAEASAYLKSVSEKLEGLIEQMKACKNDMTPDYEITSRAEYLRKMFDREMRFPLRDRWNSVEEAKTHTDKAFESCQEHAYRMHWINNEEPKPKEHGNASKSLNSIIKNTFGF